MISRLRQLVRRLARRGSTGPAPGTVDPRGPVFLSYRHSDGLTLATDIAWALRAAGVPVWHDQSDLPPGDTDRRLAEALGSGLSGALLLVTPEIAQSRVVREIELPRLFGLAEDAAFTLSVLSVIKGGADELDYDAPDRLLSQPAGTLKRLDQQPADGARQRADAAGAQCRRRMQAIRGEVEATGNVITVDVQTRIPPFAARVDADLVLRLRPPIDGDRRPNRHGLDDLSLFLGDLPHLLAFAGAEHARIRGGAHLSVAYAIGAALPTTLIGRIEVVDTGGALWALSGQAPAPNESSPLLSVESVSTGAASSGAILVYMDLLPTPSDAAFADLVSDHADTFGAAVHVRSVRSGNLRSEKAAALVGEASQVIRGLSGQYHARDVHLLLRCPWTVALLLGRTLNTLPSPRVRVGGWPRRRRQPRATKVPAEPRRAFRRRG